MNFNSNFFGSPPQTARGFGVLFSAEALGRHRNCPPKASLLPSWGASVRKGIWGLTQPYEPSGKSLNMCGERLDSVVTLSRHPYIAGYLCLT
ncbi:MAG: hypothetical protein LDL41_12520 [Coleofasciculus sp. S288]|nr:hypothetical protein [Coleofasciculus sp. S288]